MKRRKMRLTHRGVVVLLSVGLVVGYFAQPYWW